MGISIKKIAAFAVAAVMAAGLCAAVPSDGESGNPVQIKASAAENNRSDTIRMYGTSTEAVISVFGVYTDKYTVSLYNQKTGKYEKKAESDHGDEIKITGLRANTKYQVKVEAFEVKNGKRIRKYSGTRTFTTKKPLKGKSLKAKDGTGLSVKRSAYLNMGSKYNECILPGFDKAYLIAYNSSGTNVFGYLADVNKEDPSRDYGFYTYITHDGTVDILPRRGYNYKTGNSLGGQLVKDIDGDGTDEVVSILPLTSGTGCVIDSLTVYDMGESGHYEEHMFTDPEHDFNAFEELMSKNVSIEINEDEYILTSLNSDAVYVGNTEYEHGTIEIITLYSLVCGFYIGEDGKIYMSMLPSSGPTYSYDNVPSIISEVVFDGKDFSLKNTRFEEREEY